MRLFLQSLGGIVAILLLAALLLIAGFLLVPEALIGGALRIAGLPAEVSRHIHVRQSGLTHLRLGRGHLGEMIEWDAALLRWQWPDLLQGRLQIVALDGLRFAAAIDDNGRFDAAFLDLIPASSAAAKQPQSTQQPRLPVDKLRLQNAEISLATPYGDWRAELTAGLAVASDGALSADGQAYLAAAEGAITAAFDAAQADDGDWQGQLSVEGRDIEQAQMSLAALSAQLRYRLSAESLQPDISGVIDIIGFNGPTDLQQLTVDGALEDGSGRLTISGALAEDAADASIELWLKQVWSAKPQFAFGGSLAADNLAAVLRLLSSELQTTLRTVQPTLFDGAGVSIGLGGKGELSLPIEQLLQVPPESLPLSLTGNIDLDFQKLPLPMEAGLLAGKLQLDTAYGGQQWDLAITQPASLTLQAMNRNNSGWPAPFTEGADIALRARQNSERPYFDLHYSAGRLWADADMTAAVAPPDAGEPVGRAELNLTGGLIQTAEADISLLINDINVTSAGLTLPGLQLSELLLSGEVQGDIDALQGKMTGSGQARALDLASELPPASWNFATDWQFNNGALTLTLPRCAEIRIPKFTMASARFSALSLPLCQPAEDQMALHYGPGGRIAGNLSLAPIKAEIDVVLEDAGGDTITLQSRSKTPIRYQFDPSSLQASAGLRDLRLSAEKAAADFILHRGEVSLAWQQSRGLLADVNIVRSRLEDRREAPIIAPLAIAGAARLQQQQASSTLQVNSATGQTLATMRGHHDLSKQSGRAIINLADLDFSPDGLQPQSLIPYLSGLARSVTGQVGGNASFSWDQAEVESAAGINIRDLSLQTPWAEINGIRSELLLSALWPPQTAGEQQVTIDLLDFGRVLENGVIHFESLGEDQLRVREALWPWADGKVSIEDSRIDLNGEEISLLLKLQDLDLQQTTQLLDIDNLSATGRVNGALPIVIRERSVFIKDGQLSAAEPGGILRYNDPDTFAKLAESNESAGLLAQALENFHYDSLQITANGNTENEMEVTLTLQGDNPDLLNATPFKLNFNFGGPFGDIIRLIQ